MLEQAPIFNDNVRKLEEKQKAMIDALASSMHESWRQGRLNTETNTITPRIKEIKDEEWISKNNGITEIDIANTKFEDLPADWKEENYLSAKVAIEKIEDLLNLIHDNWLDRNDQHASVDQKAQFSRLPKAEKLKDLDVLEEAIRTLRERLD